MKNNKISERLKKIFSSVHSSEKGVALIFTLGILGLLTVLALGFASTALTGRKAAENMANVTNAQMIAHSALERVLASLSGGINAEQIISKSMGTNAPPRNSCDWIWKLDTKLDGATIYELPVNYDADADVSWQYVQCSAKNNEIIGRFAYKVITEKGRLDPSLHFGTKLDGTVLERIGNDEAEINLKNAFIGLDATSDDGESGVEKLRNQINTLGRRWIDMSEVFLKLGMTDAVQKDKMKLIAETRMNPDGESYWQDANQDAKKDRGENYHRFNLARTDWDSIGVDKLLEPIAAYDANTNTGGIGWLANWQKERDANWTKDIMKKQIAANIIQYCRLETADTVSDSEDWITINPTYAGVGKHPLLNEVAMAMNVAAEVVEKGTSGTDKVFDARYSVTMKAGAEIIDLFGIGTKQDAEVLLYGNFSFEYLNPETGAFEAKKFSLFPPDEEGNLVSDNLFAPSPNLIFLADGWSGGYQQKWSNDPTGAKIELKYAPAASYYSVTAASDTDAKAKLKIRNVRLTISKAILKYKTSDGTNKYRDFARIDSNIDFPDETVLNSEASFSGTWETEDPRVNHYPSDWIARMNANSLGQPNKPNGLDISIAATEDLEVIGNDPAWRGTAGHLASAYIRQKPMTSLWELSCISRAEKWKTLNLKKAKPFSTSVKMADQGGGEYADGDANILDQVKLTASNSRYGKVNLNTDQHAVLEALLNEIKESPTSADRIRQGISLYKDLQTADPADSLEDPKTLLKATAVELTPRIEIPKVTEHSIPDNNCLACQILERSKILPFKKRSDLLLARGDIATLGSNKEFNSSQQTALEDITERIHKILTRPEDITNIKDPSGTKIPKATTKAEQEQLIGKFINLTKAEPLDQVYVVILGQTIKDVGGTTVFVDWKRNGNVADSVVSWTSGGPGEFRRTGYVRSARSGEGGKWKFIAETSKLPTLKNSVNAATGVYDLGVDKITATAKIVAVVARDGTGKWRIQRLEYVE